MRNRSAVVYGFLAFLVWSFLVGCKAPEYGCSKRDQKSALRHLNKALDKCEQAVQEKVAIMYPVKEYDSVSTRTTKGEITVTRDTVIVRSHDTVYRYVTETLHVQDTLYRDRFKIQENTAQVQALSTALRNKEAEMSARLNAKDQEATELKVASGKKDQEIKGLHSSKRKWMFCFLGLVAYIIGTRLLKWKFPFLAWLP